MLFSTTTYRDFTAARRWELWVVVVASFILLDSIPANAEMILSGEFDRTEQSPWSLDEQYLPASYIPQNELFERSFIDWSICDAGTSTSTASDTTSPTVPSEPSDEPIPSSKTPFVVLGIPTSSSGAGAGADSGSSGSGVAFAVAIACWNSELPRLTLIAYLDAVNALDIPPAPRFELLRPPQVLTIIA
jgi:hypothetical protein